ncbi:arrestin [Thelonectria olida]|uniref:Arrestin n=1 Tax=Thelonectria olida TaxID=1576542 RepID=A0A9P8WH82_9HYPO|nr:arrestin [Thelonectria olida]
MKVLNDELHRRWRTSTSTNTNTSLSPSPSPPSSIKNSDAGSILSFARRTPPTDAIMHIKLKNHYNSKVYSSRSLVAGEVVIAPPCDVPFDHVSILLVGATKTRTEVSQFVQTASHTFLRLEMPIPESTFPVPTMFEGGRTYSVPFEFVIPEHLTLSACRHKNVSEDVAHQHIRPPPSMGFWEKDDLSPTMARVEYAVIAIVYGEPERASCAKPSILVETSKRINVLPASVEDPPLDITARDRAYSLEKSTSIRKHLFAAKKGRISTTVAQPAPIRVRGDGTMPSNLAVDVNFSFDPTSANDAPPEVSHVSAKLQSTTWFSRMPMGNLPNVGTNQAAITGIAHQSYSTSLALDNTELKKSSWKAGRRSSLGSLRSLTLPDVRRQSESAVQASQPSVEAAPRRRSEGGILASLSSSLHLSLQIPTGRRLLLPTFHACLVSRTYTLQLHLTLGTTKVNLAIPVQVVVEPLPENMVENASLPTFEDALAAQEEADADELLRPRIMTPPAHGARNGDVLPGYD